MTRLNWMMALFFMATALIMPGCDEDSEPMGKGEAEFEITDAPADDANIQGVVVTVADIKVNGNSLQGFSRQSIDLKAYSEGRTKILGSGELDARTYDNLTLVLDLDKDASGNTPGSYVLDKNNTKIKLKTTTSGTADIVLNKSWKVTKGAKSSIVMDFDLRKAIRRDDTQGYSFVSDNNLKAAVKLVSKANTGTIQGSYSEDQHSNADKIIVYAYKKGSFQAGTETTPQGEDQLMFANAHASAEVRESITGNRFVLAFLEEGEYELHFAAYKKDAAGRLQFQSRLQSDTSVNGSAGGLTVKSGVTIQVSATIKGII